MAHGEFASGEVLPSEKVATFLFMTNRAANTCEVFIGQTSCLAASLEKFELSIQQICRFGLPHTKIPVNMSNSRNRSTKSLCSRSRILPYTL